MVTVKDVYNKISEFAPGELSESWDNDGVMLCEDSGKQVKNVAVMLEVSDKGVDFAIENNIDLIVTHHPLIFKPISRLCGIEYKLFKKLINAGITVLSFHTRMDSAETGVNETFAKILGLENIEGFGGEHGTIGRVGTLSTEMKPCEFAKLLKEKLGCGTVRASVFDDENRTISKVAVVGGAGKSFFYDAYLTGADAYVTSEVAHNTFIDCKALDMCILDCGHYYTENAVCERFKAILAESFSDSISVSVYDVKSPYINL